MSPQIILVTRYLDNLQIYKKIASYYALQLSVIYCIDA